MRGLPGLAAMIVTATMLLTPCAALAGSGVAELTLDRAVVSALLSASLPRSETVSLAGMGDLLLTIETVNELRFRDGEVHAIVTVTLRAASLDAGAVTGRIRVRYAPAVERTTGTSRLVALSARPVAPLRLDADLARWLPPIELPRRMNWTLPLGEGAAIDLALFVQGLEIDEDRLRVDLGVAAKPKIEELPRP